MDAALEYHDRGFSILPLNGRRSPVIQEWESLQSHRADIGTIRGWFRRKSVRGIGIICGSVSGGLVVRDFDVVDSYIKWRDSPGRLYGALPTARTPRGYHVYFRADVPGVTVRDLGDGELRVCECYVVGPPSVRDDGGRYAWTVPLNGALPLIDPFEAGLASSVATEQPPLGRVTEHTEHTEHTEAILLPCCNSVAFLETLPKTHGQRNHCIFELARYLKFLPEYIDAHPRDLRPIVHYWHKLALPFIRTKPFEDSWADFLHAWKRVTVPPGESILNIIAARAKQSETPAWCSHYEDPRTVLLAKVCREFQRASGDSPFYLSCRTAGRLAGMDHNTAWHRLGLFEDEGILETVIPGTKVRAVRWRFIEPKNRDATGPR